MIREWMSDDGLIAQYDTDSRLIQYLNASRENVVPPREINESEIARFSELYPEASPATLLEKQALVASLYEALVAMRGVTADYVVTGDELQQALPAVTRALERYRDYTGPADEVTDRLVNLLLSQSVLGVQILVSNAYTGIFNVTVQNQQLMARIEALESAQS